MINKVYKSKKKYNKGGNKLVYNQSFGTRIQNSIKSLLNIPYDPYEQYKKTDIYEVNNQYDMTYTIMLILLITFAIFALLSIGILAIKLIVPTSENVLNIFKAIDEDKILKYSVYDVKHHETWNRTQEEWANLGLPNNGLGNNKSGASKEAYKYLFDFNSFIFENPGGGAYPAEEIICPHIQSGGTLGTTATGTGIMGTGTGTGTGTAGNSSNFGNILISKSLSDAQIINPNQHGSVKVFKNVQLNTSDITTKIKDYFARFNYKSNDYVIFKLAKDHITNTLYGNIPKIKLK